jgi:ATP/maltotriose-dependent transcriptional regulator MalT/DNA-binding SARP family transcriptional activator
MAEMTATYVRRDRLVRRLLASQVGLIEAGAGYGKSVLASQYRQALGVATVYVPLGLPDSDPAVLISSLRRALRSARLSDLLSATDTAEPVTWIDRLLDALVAMEAEVLLIFDDAHHLSSEEAAALVIRLARGLPARHRFLIAARSLAGPLESVWALEGATRLDTSALAFTAGEAAELIRRRMGYRAPELDLKVLVEATQGWATGLVVAAAGGFGIDGGRTPRLSLGPDLIASPLRGILGALAPDDRHALVQLAHLPFLSAELCEAVTGSDGSFGRLVAVGVPLARAESGWWEMPSPVAAYLASLGPVADATVLAAGGVYARHGEVLAAIRVLLGAGMGSEAAAALADVPLHRVEDLGLAVIRDVVEALPEPAIRAHPGVLLHLARVAETAHQADLRSEMLARAARLSAADGRRVDPLGREIDAERARDLVWDERTRGEAKALATSVIEHAGDDELVARARALDVLGRLASWFSSTGPQPAAEMLLKESARLARRVGQRTWAAQALVPLAMGFYFARCHYERALGVLDEALVDLPARNRYRALVQSFRTELLVEVGRYAEAESCVAEVREIGRSCREEWVLAYASWGEANLASYQGDEARTVRAVLDVERHRDVWYEQASGVEFLSQAADFLDRAGEHALAVEYLGRAQERMAGCERPVKVYGAGILGRSGDPVEAEKVISAVLAGPAAEPQERWPLLVLRAHAAVRRGAADAGRLAADAFDTCLALGHPEGPLLRERAVAEALLPLAAAAGSRAAAALMEHGGRLSIRLLGGFEISRAGRRVELPAGRPGKAVRAVAVAGGRIHAEELIELLWPQTDLLTGRNRLRNLLSRVRVADDDLLEREGEMVTLAPGFEIDAQLFDAQAHAALSTASAGNETRAVVLARSALERYRGDLLPDDRYEPWAAAPRERLRLRYLELLDLLAADAERRAEVDEAARLIRRALDAEPYDEQRYVQLARLLASQGRAGSALAVLRQARAALDELGLDASTGLEELDRALHGRLIA